MRIVILAFGVISLSLSANVSPAAAQTLPPDQTVFFQIHEVPSDPGSPLAYEIECLLEAVGIDGSDVAWDVTKVTVTKFTSGNNVTYEDAAPTVDTQDGYWWVTHAVPLAPDHTEFAQPPLLVGSAAPLVYRVADLDYEFEAGWCDSTCQALYDDPTALTFAFAPVNDPMAADEGEDEPADQPETIG